MKNNETVLVTGGTGFIGIYCILQLLQKEYKVRTTLRKISKKSDVIQMLNKGGITNTNNLEFIEADLANDDNWDEAVKGCDYVLHVASPFPITEPKNPDEIIIPAKEGTLRVLKAARDAKVKRVVLTSSFAAIGYSIETKNHIFTEEDWTDPNANITAYIKSKTLAEKAAWEFINNEGGDLELSVINPVAVLGPILGGKLSTSIQMVEQLMSAKMPAIPKINFGIVDVRDVADIHIRAMTSPGAKWQRFLAVSDNGTLSLPEMADILRVQPNKYAGKVPKRIMPDWLVKFAARFKPELKPIASQVNKAKDMSNKKAREVLNWQPRNKEIAIADTAESLIQLGIVK